MPHREKFLKKTCESDRLEGYSQFVALFPGDFRPQFLTDGQASHLCGPQPTNAVFTHRAGDPSRTLTIGKVSLWRPR
jgi:hypothetical protein